MKERKKLKGKKKERKMKNGATNNERLRRKDG